jgi:hypothetical protein
MLVQKISIAKTCRQNFALLNNQEKYRRLNEVDRFWGININGLFSINFRVVRNKILMYNTT